MAAHFSILSLENCHGQRVVFCIQSVGLKESGRTEEHAHSIIIDNKQNEYVNDFFKFLIVSSPDASYFTDHFLYFSIIVQV